MKKGVLRYIVGLALLIVLIVLALLFKVNSENNFEAKVANYSAKSLLGSSFTKWECKKSTSECLKNQVKITHKSNDVVLLCSEIFDSKSPLRSFAKGEYLLNLPLPGVVNEILPANNQSFAKTELYQQCIATASSAEGSLVARVTGNGVLFEIQVNKLKEVFSIVVLTDR